MCLRLTLANGTQPLKVLCGCFCVAKNFIITCLTFSKQQKRCDPLPVLHDAAKYQYVTWSNRLSVLHNPVTGKYDTHLSGTGCQTSGLLINYNGLFTTGQQDQWLDVLSEAQRKLAILIFIFYQPKISSVPLHRQWQHRGHPDACDAVSIFTLKNHQMIQKVPFLDPSMFHYVILLLVHKNRVPSLALCTGIPKTFSDTAARVFGLRNWIITLSIRLSYFLC